MKIYFEDGKPVYDDTVFLGQTYIDYSTLSKSQMKRWKTAFDDKKEEDKKDVTKSNKT